MDDSQGFLELQVTPEQERRFRMAASEAGLPVEDWILKILREALGLSSPDLRKLD